MDRLRGKIALITGGGSGFGATMGRLFAREGASVVLTDKNAPAATAVAAEIGGGAVALAHDVTVEAEWTAVMDEVRARFGRLDILVNNAGVYGTGATQKIEEMTLEEWRFVNSVNADGVFLGCKAAVPLLRDSGGGSIVNISSIAGLRGTPHLTAYCASKGSVRLLTKSVAVQCARNGYRIRCNSVHPGMVRTTLGDAVLELGWGDAERGAAERVKQVPLGELGTPEDVAYAALFLASDESRHVTGSELIVDGGATA